MNSMDKDKFARFFAGLVFMGFIITIVISNNAAKNAPKDGAIVPTITADSSPIKIKPKLEGGIDIPFRDAAIYDSVEEAKDDVATSKVVEVPQTQEVEFKEEIVPVVEKTTVTKTPTKTASSKQRNVDDLVSSISKETTTKPTASSSSSGNIGRPSPFSNYRAQLGSLKSEREAQSVWDRLSRRYSILNNRTLHIDKTQTNGGTYYRVQTNLMTEGEAKAICAKISRCLVVKAM